MAASNAPKHDFAPPWLKIPNPNENTRPAGSRNQHTQDRGRQRHDDGYYNRYSGRDCPRPLNRQNSFDMSDGSRHFSPNHASKFRHHSVEDGYMTANYYSQYPHAYNDYSMQNRSQPSLPRQDMKYPPTSSRFGQVNGGYNGLGSVSDFYPLGDGFNNYGNGGHSGKRSHYARDGRVDSRDSRDSDRSQKDGDKDKTFNDDFPSLNGADEDGDVKTSKNASSGGVWDNPPRSKVEDSADTKSLATGSSLYKIVSTKAGSARKNSRDSILVNGNTREGSPRAAIKPRPSREGQQHSPTQLEILSTPFVCPKPVDKRSEFLKAMRKEADTDSGPQNRNGSHDCLQNGIDDHNIGGLQNGTGDHKDGRLQNGLGNHDDQESNNHGQKDEKEEAQEMMNGVVELQLDRDTENHLLNGSFHLKSPVRAVIPYQMISKLHFSEEEETRFLRSMGWDESAETEEITEDEKKEFLKKRTIHQQQRNGGNGSGLLSKSSSPQHLAPASS